MPLLKIRSLGSEVMLGLWQITETVDDFLSSNDFIRSVFKELPTYKNEFRTREQLAIYSLLFQMVTPFDKFRITHLESGKPELEGYQISISHTKGYAALILSKTTKVAVDIEYISDRVNRVATRFIRSDEMATTTSERLIHWCTKETIFKLFSKENLTSFDIRIQPFDYKSQGVCSVEDLKIKKLQTVHFEVNSNYIMTFAILESEVEIVH